MSRRALKASAGKGKGKGKKGGKAGLVLAFKAVPGQGQEMRASAQERSLITTAEGPEIASGSRALQGHVIAQ